MLARGGISSFGATGDELASSTAYLFYTTTGAFIWPAVEAMEVTSPTVSIHVIAPLKVHGELSYTFITAGVVAHEITPRQVVLLLVRLISNFIIHLPVSYAKQGQNEDATSLSSRRLKPANGVASNGSMDCERDANAATSSTTGVVSHANGGSALVDEVGMAGQKRVGSFKSGSAEVVAVKAEAADVIPEDPAALGSQARKLILCKCLS